MSSTSVPRPCITSGCRATTTGTRCSQCQAAWERDRLRRFPQRVAYRDPRYTAAKLHYKGAVCHLCGLPGSDTLDHVVPLAVDPTGGGPANWAPAHRACNSRKHDRGART